MLFAGRGNGSSDRLVADMDDQNREVEEGIAGKLVQQLPLLTAVVRDAAAQTSKPVRLPHMLCDAVYLSATVKKGTCYTHDWLHSSRLEPIHELNPVFFCARRIPGLFCMSKRHQPFGVFLTRHCAAPDSYAPKRMPALD